MSGRTTLLLIVTVDARVPFAQLRDEFADFVSTFPGWRGGIGPVAVGDALLAFEAALDANAALDRDSESERDFWAKRVVTVAGPDEYEQENDQYIGETTLRYEEGRIP